MTGTPSVRIASPADAEAVAALMTELDHPIPADQAHRYLASLADSSDTIVFVAAIDERVCGLIAGHLLPVLSESNPILMIIALSVTVAYQRSGAGQALVTRLEAWGRENGAARVLVTTALRREGAHAFYERMGYSYSGRRYSRTL
jgi:predicted N-acetyltransferase YhbS